MPAFSGFDRPLLQNSGSNSPHNRYSLASQAVPVESVVFHQLCRLGRHAATPQIIRAGVCDTHHARQWSGHQPVIGQLPGAQLGGGLIAIPLLGVLFGLDQQIAQGTALVDTSVDQSARHEPSGCTGAVVGTGLAE